MRWPWESSARRRAVRRAPRSSPQPDDSRSRARRLLHGGRTRPNEKASRPMATITDIKTAAASAVPEEASPALVAPAMPTSAPVSAPAPAPQKEAFSDPPDLFDRLRPSVQA